jgi:hypothetical protein
MHFIIVKCTKHAEPMLRTTRAFVADDTGWRGYGGVQATPDTPPPPAMLMHPEGGEGGG